MCIAGIDNVLLHSKLYDSVLTCVALQALTREVLPDPTDLRVHPVTRVPMVQSDDLENQVYTLLYVCYYKNTHSPVVGRPASEQRIRKNDPDSR